MMSFQKRAWLATQWLGVALVLVLVFPTALVNFVLALLLLAYVVSGNYAEKWTVIRRNPIARASLWFLAAFVVGMSYSPLDVSESASYLLKYKELLIIPMIISIFDAEYWRRRAYVALFVSIGIAVILSYAMYFGWGPQAVHHGEEFVPFKGRIAFGFFLAYGIYLMLHHAIQSASNLHRLLWIVFALICACDLLLLTSGRTGHLIFLVMIILLFIQYRWGSTKRAVLTLLLVIFMTMAALAFSPASKIRLAGMKNEAISQSEESVGQRLIFWDVSLRMIQDHPILGIGTGGFATGFALHNTEFPGIQTGNPHNEYLLIAAQLGVVGLLIFLWWLYLQFAMASRLLTPYSFAVQGLVVAMVVGCLFNSFLRDHGEGHFFAVLSGLYFSSLVPAKRDS